MRMRFKALGLIGAICIALSALADKAHDVFEANKDVILAQPITVCGDVTFAVGRATSPRNRGDAVGYAKAEAQAKWNLGERHRVTAAWPNDILESERDDAWLEYRSQHPERFSVVGMQRMQTKKTTSDNYMVVLCFPTEQVNVSRPTPVELKAALDKVRERKKKAEEACAQAAMPVSGRKAQMKGADSAGGVSADTTVHTERPQPTAESVDGEVKKHDGFDECLML